MRTYKLIFFLPLLLAMMLGVTGCSSDEEENVKIIDFDKYKDPSDTIIGSWEAICGSWELIESTPKTQTSVVVSFTKDKSWKATYSNPTGVPFQTISASTFDRVTRGLCDHFFFLHNFCITP